MNIYSFAPQQCGCSPPVAVSCCPGPMGPTGPAGSAATVTFDPSQSSIYKQGQTVVMPDGTIYVATKNNPAGTPGSSPDYTAIAGGSSKSSIFDPSQTGAYTQGQLVVYNGALYLVNRNAPTGIPGSSSDFTAISGGSGVGRMGPTGPTGPAASSAYDPYQTGQYKANDMIYYNGNLYAVNKDNPSGTPGVTGADYTQLTNSSRIARDTGSVVSPWNPTDAASFATGQLTTYNGQLYQLVGNPTTVQPDTSTAYRNLSSGGITGPTGATGTIIYPQLLRACP